MSDQNQYKFLLQSFTKLPKNIQKLILKNADPKLTREVCEICLNISNGNIELSSQDKKKIKRKQRVINALGLKKGSFKRKIKYIRQKGHGLLPLLISIAGPVIASLLTQ